ERSLALLGRDRRAGDPAAVVAGRIGGHCAPARADLEKVVVGGELESLADPLQPVELCLAKARLWAWEDRARVHHRLVEIEGDQVVAEVVVRRDVAARGTPAVARNAPQG